MSKSLEPKQGDSIEKPFSNDIKKGYSSFNAPPKPETPKPAPKTTNLPKSKN